MNDHKFEINSLTIAAPCSVGWETMAGDERTRHCDKCRLNVYNVSALTSGEVERLIAKREGSVCVKMYRRFDGTVLTKDCPVGLRAARKRVARFAGATLGAVLGLFSISFGQKEDNKTINGSAVPVIRTAIAADGSKLTGTVLDQMGAVIPNIQITLLQGKDKKAGGVSDEDGAYNIEKLSPGKYDLMIKSTGGFLEYRIVNLEIRGHERLELNITLVAGGVTVGLLEVMPEAPMLANVLTITSEIQPRKPVKP